MAKIRRSPISDTEWEGHKDAIRKLYLLENKRLDSEDGVVALMSARYNFSARYDHFYKSAISTGFPKAKYTPAQRNMRLDSRNEASTSI